jgi:hypothetical protein
MKTCATCKHWDSVEYASLPPVRMCRNVVQFWDCTEWDDNCNRVVTDKYKDTKAFVQDGSDYRGVLLTRSNFGCVSHKDKEA